MRLRLAILALAAALSSGCATIVHGGWNQSIPVSAPPGTVIKATPSGDTITGAGAFKLRRNRTHYLSDGAQTITIKPGLSPWIIGNIGFGGIIGICVDAIGGGGWRLDPPAVTFAPKESGDGQ
jgi:hypothetical protein